MESLPIAFQWRWGMLRNGGHYSIGDWGQRGKEYSYRSSKGGVPGMGSWWMCWGHCGRGRIAGFVGASQLAMGF